MRSLFVIIFSLLSAFQCSVSMIEEFSTVSTNIFTQIITESFGMSDQGQIDITYSIGPESGISYPASPLLIAIINEGQKYGYYSNLAQNTCNLPTLFREVIYGNGNITYYTSEGADLYTVLIMQCRNGNPLSPVSANVQVTMKNPKPNGSGYQYLPINQVSYISILEGLIICYCILIGALVLQMAFAL